MNNIKKCLLFLIIFLPNTNAPMILHSAETPRGKTPKKLRPLSRSWELATIRRYSLVDTEAQQLEHRIFSNPYRYLKMLDLLEAMYTQASRNAHGRFFDAQKGPFSSREASIHFQVSLDYARKALSFRRR